MPLKKQLGFSLIEIAVVLFIIVLLLGSILVPLQTQVEQSQISTTEKALDEIKQALIGFALTNSYLPCPDTTGDGVSDPNMGGTCSNSVGFIPWVTLNVSRGDVWGNRFRYRVTPDFTNTPLSAGACLTGDGRLGLCDNGNITINTRDPSTKTIQALATNVVAVIISHGKNGYGATSIEGVARSSPIGADETTNAASGTTFISRTFVGPTTSTSACSDTTTGSPYCEFDDILTWISRYTLFNRMVVLGKLP